MQAKVGKAEGRVNKVDGTSLRDGAAGILGNGAGQGPSISLSISPKSSPGYLLAGIAIGAVAGFAVGSVVTLLIGEKSLLLLQHLWNRLTSSRQDGDRVHFELLLQ